MRWDFFQTDGEFYRYSVELKSCVSGSKKIVRKCKPVLRTQIIRKLRTKTNGECAIHYCRLNIRGQGHVDKVTRGIHSAIPVVVCTAKQDSDLARC